MIVYLITNKINGMQYVGQTLKSLEQRWKEHTQIRQKPSCRYLYAAIQKYGLENFEIRVLITTGTKDSLNYYESELIKALGTKAPLGYNLTDGGGGAHGFKFTEEQKKKISLGLLGRKMSDKARQKLLERNKGNKFFLGHKLSDEHRKFLLEHNTGKKASESTKQKMSAAHTGRKHSEETKQRIREGHQRRRERENQWQSTIPSAPSTV